MISATRRFLRRLHEDTDGAMSVEKILILAIIALPILLIMIIFRDKLVGWFNGQSNQLNTDPNAGGNANGNGGAAP